MARRRRHPRRATLETLLVAALLARGSRGEVAGPPVAPPPGPEPGAPIRRTVYADYFFLHMAKTGGTSFNEMVAHGRLSGVAPCHRPMHTGQCRGIGRQAVECDVKRKHGSPPCAASSEGKLQSMRLDADVKLWISIRRPLRHVVSMWAHCQQPGALGQTRHRYPAITFDAWIDKFERGAPDARDYCSYKPVNWQVHHLGQSFDEAVAAVNRAEWILLTDHYVASVCWIGSLRRKAAACACGDRGKKLLHRTHGTNTSAVEVAPATAARVRRLTRLDEALYRLAFFRLHDGLRAYGLECLLPEQIDDA